MRFGFARIVLLSFAAGLGAGALSVLTICDLKRPASARTEATRSLVSGRSPLAGAYQAHVVTVIDGDTVEARVQVWMGHEVLTRVRLKDIDAPELRGACASERDQAQASRDRLAGLVGGRSVVLTDIRPDKYFGRVIARIISPDGVDAGGALLAGGLARPYRGGRRQGWCDQPVP